MVTKSKIIKIPILFGKIKVIYTTDTAYVLRLYKKPLKYKDRTAFVFRHEDFYVACFSVKDLNIIVHESVHIVNYIFEDTHIKPDVKNDELQAYLTAWVFDEINNFINKN